MTGRRTSLEHSAAERMELQGLNSPYTICEHSTGRQAEKILKIKVMRQVTEKFKMVNLISSLH